MLIGTKSITVTSPAISPGPFSSLWSELWNNKNRWAAKFKPPIGLNDIFPL